MDGTKALGGWSEGSCFRPCYDRALPVDALLGAATFNARKPESYSLPRNALGKSSPSLSFPQFGADRMTLEHADPPPELIRQLFPWIEQEQAALNARSAADPNARDFALKHFLTLLSWLRHVLLQDAAVLSTSHSSLQIFRYAPFNTAAFQSFASTSASVVAQAAEDARLQLQNLPDQYALTFRGLITSSAMEQQRVHAAQNRQIVELTQTVEKMAALLEMQSGSKKSRRRRREGQLHFVL